MERSSDDQVEALLEKQDDKEHQCRQYRTLTKKCPNLAKKYEARTKKDTEAYKDLPQFAFRAAQREADLANDNLRLRNDIREFTDKQDEWTKVLSRCERVLQWYAEHTNLRPPADL